MVFMIYSSILPIMNLSFPQSIFLSDQLSMNHLPIPCNFHKMSRHFSSSWWLCQVLPVLRPILILIRIVMYLSRSSSLDRANWRSTHISIFASSACFARCHPSIIRGSVPGKIYYETQFFLFFMFSKFRSSKYYSWVSHCYDVHKHHHASEECLACAFFFYFFACAFTLQMSWYDSFYLSNMLSCLNIFLDMDSLAHIG